MPEYYEIKIRGHLDPCWSDWFAGLKLTHLEGKENLLSGLLGRIRDLNLKLISVNCSGLSTLHSDKE